MQVTDSHWSDTEKDIAKVAFDRAYEREIDALLQRVREHASTVTRIEDMWRLHDFLSARRHEVDGKYDYQYSMLVFVFAQLVKEGWLHLDELQGLSTDKLAKVAALARM